MNKFILKLGLRPGDRIIVPKSGIRIIQHHAIYLGQNVQGQHLFTENKIGIGVRAVTAEEFFRDVIEVTRIERFTGSNSERKKAVQKALSKLGLSYNLINYNCQHFANEVQYGKAESDQVSKGLFIGLAILLGLFITTQE